MSLSVSLTVSKIQQQGRRKLRSEASTIGQGTSPSCFWLMTLWEEQCCVQGETCRASTPEKCSHRKHLEKQTKSREGLPDNIVPELCARQVHQHPVSHRLFPDSILFVSPWTLPSSFFTLDFTSQADTETVAPVLKVESSAIYSGWEQRAEQEPSWPAGVAGHSCTRLRADPATQENRSMLLPTEHWPARVQKGQQRHDGARLQAGLDVVEKV